MKIVYDLNLGSAVRDDKATQDSGSKDCVDLSSPNAESRLSIHEPLALTIGNFDGLHIGHQAVLNRLNEVAKKNHLLSAVITFENHPYEVLNPQSKVATLCTLAHKIRLLEQHGIDILILLKFTKQFSQQTAEEFLTKVFNTCHFSQLVLGYDNAFGKDKKGDRKHIQSFANELGFTVEYIPPFKIKDKIVSSSIIKNLIQEGKFTEAAALLGRPYSIVTSNLNVKNLCLPPAGDYPITIQNKRVIATIRENSLILNQKFPENETIEIIFNN